MPIIRVTILNSEVITVSHNVSILSEMEEEKEIHK